MQQQYFGYFREAKAIAAVLMKSFVFILCLVFLWGFWCSGCLGQNTATPDLDNLTLYSTVFETETRWMHEVYLMILCGFCSILLLLLYRSTKEKGILYLSLAVLCWFFSGLSAYVAIAQNNPEWIKVGTSVCSTLNSVFLLLMLSHLDPDDLPGRVQILIASGAKQFVLWVGIFILMLYILFFTEQFWQGFYFADMVFSGITLALLFFSFWFIFKNRVSLVVAIVSWVALILTLFAHIFRALPQNAQHFLKINELEFEVWSATLMFSYKPLLIVTFFVLIVSWLWKRLNNANAGLETEKAGMQQKHETEVARLQQQWNLEKLELQRRHEPGARNPVNLPAVDQNRKMKYPRLDETDWKIVERIAKGDKVPAITKFLEVKDGFVPPRIEKIANALNSSSGAQIDILRLALLNGVLEISDLDED